MFRSSKHTSIIKVGDMEDLEADPKIFKKKAPKNYVDNKVLTAEVIAYNDLLNKMREEALIKYGPDYDLSLVKLKPNDYLGQSIVRICTGLAHKSNFINYSYRDEMILAAQILCIDKLKNFNPEKSNNAFAYLTQVAYNEMVTTISKEKLQHNVKYKMMMNMDVESLVQMDGDEEVRTEMLTILRDIAGDRLKELKDSKEGNIYKRPTKTATRFWGKKKDSKPPKVKAVPIICELMGEMPVEDDIESVTDNRVLEVLLDESLTDMPDVSEDNIYDWDE